MLKLRVGKQTKKSVLTLVPGAHLYQNEWAKCDDT